MKNNGQLVLGGSIIIFGLLILLGTLFNISLWKFIWPLILIALGIFLIFRQRKIVDQSDFSIHFAGNLKRKGQWVVTSGEHWGFFSNLNLDFTNAEFQEGEHVWKIHGFVNEIRLRVPSKAAVAVSANAFVNEKTIDGDKEDMVLVPLEWHSDNYNNSPNKFRIEAYGFVVDTRITTFDLDKDELE